MERTIIDNLLPKEIAIIAENIGVKKGNLDFFSMLNLGILAGAYIATGAAFYTLVISGNGVAPAVTLPLGVIKLLGGIAFSLGLIMVVIAGAELFTGNVLVVMATASRKLPIYRLLYNWFVVYIGNFIGSIITAYLIFSTGYIKLFKGAVGLNAVTIANTKCGLPFTEAIAAGIFCNLLVCLAVWLTLSGRTTTDKIISIIFPIAAFVAMGFEHCVANMYFIPLGIFIRNGSDFSNLIAGSAALDTANLSWGNFLAANLLPVTLGNIIGGFIVGMTYWTIYCRKNNMDIANEEAFLKRLIKIGRRGLERFEVEGVVTLKKDPYSVKGKIKDVSLSGMSGTFSNDDLLPGKHEKLSVDLESYDNKLCILGLQGVITRKKIVDLKFVEMAVKFTDDAYEKKNELLNYINVKVGK